MNDANGCVAKFGRTLAHFYTLWSYIVLTKPADAQPEMMATRYAKFMEKVTQVLHREISSLAAGGDPEYRILADYVLNMRGATTDATPRLDRHRALSAALEETV
jgi:hypothetical protein